MMLNPQNLIVFDTNFFVHEKWRGNLCFLFQCFFLVFSHEKVINAKIGKVFAGAVLVPFSGALENMHKLRIDGNSHVPKQRFLMDLFS